MATTTQSRSFRAARRPGSLELLTEGIRDVWSRRRLARYLVQADLHKNGADTLLGNVWWILDPLLQMAVYVVFVSVILQRGDEDYPLFIFCAILPWKWFSSRSTTRSPRSPAQERLIKQVQFPKIVLPVAATLGRYRQLRVRADPALRADAAVLRDGSRPCSLIPVIAVVQFVFTLAVASSRGRQRLLPRHRQRRAPRAAAVVLPVAGALLVDSRRDTRGQPVVGTCCRSTRSRSCSRRTAP